MVSKPGIETCPRYRAERIADIVNARRNAQSKMRQVYERDEYLFRMVVDLENELTEEQKRILQNFGIDTLSPTRTFLKRKDISYPAHSMPPISDSAFSTITSIVIGATSRLRSLETRTFWILFPPGKAPENHYP